MSLTITVDAKGIDPGTWNKTFSSLFLATIMTNLLFFFFDLLNYLFRVLEGCQLKFTLLLIGFKVFY